MLHAVITVESWYNPNAVSRTGAMGLMQLMPETAKRYGVNNRRDVKENINGGSHYLSELLRMFNNNIRLALAAYNAGPTRVRKWMRELGDPREFEVDVIDWVERIPFKETRNYVQRVLENLQVYRQILSKKIVLKSIVDDLKK